ncbi:MAG: polyprenyl synthetase family protein [Kiritimatiellia bacterium]
MELAERLEAKRLLIEEALRHALPQADRYTAKFMEGCHHAVMAGGKRIRPILTLLCAEACGADGSADALHAAVAIELLHSYTLVHDDLPAMDNDTLRRGQPTVWAKYGEGNAILVGDYLQAVAFAQLVPCVHSGALLKVLVKAAQEVIHGQVADIAAAKGVRTTWDEELLSYINTNKTAALVATACALGAIAATDDPACARILGGEFGVNLGIAFQLVDDLLDAQQSPEDNEFTALALFSPEAVRAMAEKATQAALRSLETLSGDTSALRELAQSLLKRLA